MQWLTSLRICPAIVAELEVLPCMLSAVIRAMTLALSCRFDGELAKALMVDGLGLIVHQQHYTT